MRYEVISHDDYIAIIRVEWFGLKRTTIGTIPKETFYGDIKGVSGSVVSDRIRVDFTTNVFPRLNITVKRGITTEHASQGLISTPTNIVGVDGYIQDIIR